MNGKIAFFLICILAFSSLITLMPIRSSATESVKVYADPPSVVNPKGITPKTMTTVKEGSLKNWPSQV
jgi:hypothetical protein